MSFMFRDDAIRRIRLTPPVESSQLAVFEVPDRPDFLDVVFAQTLVTNTRIESGDPRFVGVFDKTSDLRGLKCGNTFATVYT